MIKKLQILIVFLLFVSFWADAQEEKNIGQDFLEELIEEISENSDEDIDYSTLLEDLTYFLENPININDAKKEELEKLHLLSEFQIKSLQYYIEKNGKLLSIYELQLVLGYNKDLIYKILPFISIEEKTVSSSLSLKNAFKFGNNQLWFRSTSILEEQTGFSDATDSMLAESPNSRYLGSPLKIYSKYRYYYKNKLFFGVTAEKDPGEEFFKGTQKRGFDYYTAHFQVNDIGKIKTLCLGDYQVQFGQGLTVWSGMSFGKSSNSMGINKKAGGVKRYSSANENQFLRGAATTLRFGKTDVSLFGSYKKIDGNVVTMDTLSEEVLEVSSFQITGLHSTPGEMADRQTIGEKIFGGNISHRRDFYKIGLSYISYMFSGELNKDGSPYNYFNFQGTSGSNLGLNYQIFYKNFNVFGEYAVDENLSRAFVNGAIFNLSPQVSLAGLHRKYDFDYQAIYANGFSEGSSTNNEEGIYLGTIIYPVKKVKLSAYFDSFSFPWLKFRVNGPSQGIDYLLQSDFTPSRKVSMYLKFKQEKKEINESTDYVTYMAQLQDVITTKLRYHIKYPVLNEFEFQSRVEWISYKTGENLPEQGYLVYQDIAWKPKNKPLTLSVRWAAFDTDSWESRIYAYESDLLYAFSIPAYYSKGTRYYLNMKYRVSDRIDFWLKYSRTYYNDKEVIGSGLTEIKGNVKSEIRAQVRIKF